MFKTITDKKDYIKSIGVENLKINYDNKKEVNLFGNKILVEKNEWLWHLHLKLTNRCNAKCYFCVEQNSKCEENADLYLKHVDMMLSEMEKEGILFSVSVTGGEPLLFSKFDELCDILRKHDIKFLTMNTNGKYLKSKLHIIDGLFDFIDISRHDINDLENSNIFNCKDMPTIEDLKEIKSKLTKTKMRIQCVMCNMKTINDVIEFINIFSFADDLSFRKLMKLSDKHGVSYNEHEELYYSMLKYAYDNFDLKEQTIQDYYVYEIWNNGKTDITFSYSNMKMLYEVESKENKSVCREFIIHPNGIISGSWDFTNKVILK